MSLDGQPKTEGIVIPCNFKKVLNQLSHDLLSRRLDIMALVVIGSVAKGDYMDDSDVDVVCIIEEKLNYKERYELVKAVPEKIQLVVFSVNEFKKHFENFTTMAHSIQKGIILYQKDHFLRPFLEDSLALPSKKWMKDWFIHWLKFYFMGLQDLEREKEFHEKFCKEDCRCLISDNLARAALNFAILYLESHGIVPVSKGEIKKGIGSIVSQDIFQGLNRALEVCHEDRFMNHDEAMEVEKTAIWLKQKLIEGLSIGQQDMEKPLKIYDILKGVENKLSDSEKEKSLKREINSNLL